MLAFPYIEVSISLWRELENCWVYCQSSWEEPLIFPVAFTFLSLASQLCVFLFYCWHSSWVISLYLLLILSGPPVWNLLLGSGLPSLRLGPCILLLQDRVLPRIQSFRLIVHANLWQNEMCSWKVTVPVMFLNGIILNAVGSLLFKGHWEWGLLQNAAFSQGKL